ncbi:PepSY-associated TM helix domain-containing protein [Hyphococcus sp.]|uniref:PepSY-associated TM helix domain-containing protein n=1 Tax=Hyphococcus sp. TaxID=2038636 RepID=UPI003CCB7EC2
MTEKPNFRPAMNWLHTWAGVTLGTLLFTIWWMGTLSVFDKEIDRWMQPETRFITATQPLDADSVIAKVKANHPGDELASLLIYLPGERKPYFEVYGKFKEAGQFNDRLHPISGDSLGKSTSRAASGFFYPMHYRLHMGGIGYLVVALGTLFMMVLLVTGVVIHRKIFVDFFTFRPKKKIRRSSLDLHNVTGVVFLPFHFLICLSGFAIFAGWYASIPFEVVRGFSESNRVVELFYAADDYAYYRRESAGAPAKMADIAPFVARAEEIWTERYDQNAKADRIDLHHIGDANAYVEVRRFFPSRRTEAHRDSINFDGATGEILLDFQASPIRKTRTWLEGFHQIQFDHWPLRWFYFIAGLAGCILIATGFLFWTASRMKKGAVSQPVKIRFVEAMSIGSVTGIIVATGAFLIANRVLPAEASWAGLARPEIEVRLFFLVWVLSFIHPVFRSGKAWAEQSWAIAALGILAVILNWVTTSDHLFASAGRDLWSVAGMDLVLLASAGAAAFAAMRLQRRTDPSAAMRRKPDASNPVDAAKPSPAE